MIEQLRRRLGDAERRRDDAVSAVPAAVLDGGARRLAALRRERRDERSNAGVLPAARRGNVTVASAARGRRPSSRAGVP